MIEEQVPSALGGERLDRIVALIADISRADAASVIEAGAVTVDGAPARSGKERLETGVIVGIDESKIPVVELPTADPDVDFDVVYQDEDLIVVDKPSGLVVHPGSGHPDRTLVNGLLSRFPDLANVGEPFRPGIVHRLDSGTSGLLVVARSSDAYSRLVDMIGRHEVERRYLVLVWGHPNEDDFTVDAPIGRDPRDPRKMTVVPSGKEAVTHFRVLEHFGDSDMTLLECELETGRTHQIRVHLRAIGHPVVGDPTYGGQRPDLVLNRPFLHAEALEFHHPSTNEIVSFRSPLPVELEAYLGSLRTSH